MKNLRFYILIFILFFVFFLSSGSYDVYAASYGSAEINVPNIDKLYNYDDFYFSNFSQVKDGTLKEAITDVSFETFSLDNEDFEYIGDNPLFGLKIPGTTKISSEVGKTVTFPANEYTETTGLLNKIQIYFNKDYAQLKKDKSYQIAIKFNKSASLNFKKLKINKDMFNITVTDTENFLPVDVTDIVSDFSAEWKIVPDNEDSSKNSNNAYLIINFRFNEEDWTKNFNNFSLNNIDIQFNNYWGSDYVTSTNTILANTDYKKEYDFKISKFYFLENGKISISGFSEGSSGGGHSTGGGRHDNLDHVSEDDLSKFNELEICEPLDIGCHVRNILSNIKNFFVRLGNGFINVINTIVDMTSYLLNELKKLFVPSDNFFEDFVNHFNNTLSNKLGFLFYPFDLFSNLLNRYLNLSTNPVINIPDIKEPFNDVVLIKATSFNIQDTFNTGKFKELYDIYMAFVSCIIIFMFANFSIKKFNSFVKDRGGND